jgi:L-seryl-tRNA(Ser) seleniumtransferase
MDADTIYEELGVPSVINATGTKTRIGGSRIRPEAVEAMSAASQSFVRLSDLQAEASERIADLTGAEAGYVTSGASAGMLLSAAAAIAGDDISAMARLPDTGGPADTGSPAGDGGLADEIVMPRTHRTGYDHALRAAGATIVDVGTNDRHLGTGSRNVEPWEIERAIGEETAAVGYVQKEYTEPALDVVCEIAHAHDVPVIVDAAAELPPTTNFERFVDAGADLVVFSGGKAIRGPQTTGIVAGREELIASIAAQHLDMHAAEAVYEPPPDLVDVEALGGVPRQGIGRSCKVGKEELAGLLVALEAFLEEDQEATAAEWTAISERIADALAEIDGIETTVPTDSAVSVAPEVVVTVDPDVAAGSATEIVRGLRREEPRIFVGADSLDAGEFTINPMCLDGDEEIAYVLERIRAHAT